MTGRPSQKVHFPLKFLLKRAHFGASVWGVSSGWLAGRLEKFIFLSKFLLLRPHFEASVWGGSSKWPANDQALARSPLIKITSPGTQNNVIFPITPKAFFTRSPL